MSIIFVNVEHDGLSRVTLNSLRSEDTYGVASFNGPLEIRRVVKLTWKGE